MFGHLLNFIVLWLGIGCISTLTHVCIYFRGPEHMIECYKTNDSSKIKKLGQRMDELYKKNPFEFLTLSLIFRSIFGIFSFIDFLSDIIIFSRN